LSYQNNATVKQNKSDSDSFDDSIELYSSNSSTNSSDSFDIIDDNLFKA